MKRIQVARYICKLRLVRYGLLKELNELDEVEHQVTKTPLEVNTGSDEESDGDADTKHIQAQLESWTNRIITLARKEGRISEQKSEATNHARRMIIAEFMQEITKSKKCGSCGGIGHKYRKDRLVKIFVASICWRENANVSGGPINIGTKPKSAARIVIVR